MSASANSYNDIAVDSGLFYRPFTGLLTSPSISVSTSTNSVSTLTGALVVKGGTGIGGDLYVGGTIYGNLNGGGGGISNPFAGIFTITNVTAAISTDTGALQVRGGTGIGGSLHVGDQSFITVNSGITYPSFTPSLFIKNSGSNTAAIVLQNNDGNKNVAIVNYNGSLLIESKNTIATSTLTGALVVNGGVGIGGDVWIGKKLAVLNGASGTASPRSALDIYLNNTSLATSWFGASGIFDFFWDGSTWRFESSSNEALSLGPNSAIRIASGSTNNYVGIHQPNPTTWLDVGGQAKISSYSDNASSTSTGALIVHGGAAVSRDLYVGGTIYGNLSGGGGGITSPYSGIFTITNTTVA
jgi:hypothetical protein